MALLLAPTLPSAAFPRESGHALQSSCWWSCNSWSNTTHTPRELNHTHGLALVGAFFFFPRFKNSTDAVSLFHAYVSTVLSGPFPALPASPVSKHAVHLCLCPCVVMSSLGAYLTCQEAGTELIISVFTDFKKQVHSETMSVCGKWDLRCFLLYLMTCGSAVYGTNFK